MIHLQTAQVPAVRGPADSGIRSVLVQLVNQVVIRLAMSISPMLNMERRVLTYRRKMCVPSIAYPSGKSR